MNLVDCRARYQVTLNVASAQFIHVASTGHHQSNAAQLRVQTRLETGVQMSYFADKRLASIKRTALQGNYEEAEALYTKVVKIFERSLGAEHLHVATALNNWAELLREQVSCSAS